MQSRHEKIIRRDDGSRVRITVELFEPRHSVLAYRFYIHTCEKGKRTWTSPTDTNDYSYRELSMEDREKRRIEEALLVVTEEDILQAKIELWEKIKPC